MKQIVQNLKSNKGVELSEFPTPVIKKGHVLIQTKLSLISKGTERMIVEFGNASYIQKAKQKPDQIKKVFESIIRDGLGHTLDIVQSKLEQTIALGYCNYGVVLESDDEGFKKGDRVISNGPHAEIVNVPKNLVAKVPDSVNDEEAVFTVIGSIGLQGIRLCNPTYGETIVVVGLGLVGLITVQLLKANGTNVIGIDIDKTRCNIANSYGITTINSALNDPVRTVLNSTNNIGADGVIITAAAKSNEIISQSAQMSRKKGRIILVGVVGLNLNRDDFYDKELSFQVSCSYGPGRYDANYENEGNDYPIGFVRWTEKRNFEAFLQAIANKHLNLEDLITEKVSLNDYKKIYDNIDSNKSIASILVYPNEIINSDQSVKKISEVITSGQKGVIGIIGSGNFTKSTILPYLKKCNADLRYIASLDGVSSTILAKKFNINYSVTDYKKIIDDKEVDLIIISTRHNSHAKLIIEILNAGKHVFVEKPLAINEGDIKDIISSYTLSKNISLNVGYNRRFSPHSIAVKNSIGLSPGPINIIANMNAGSLPSEHWANNKNIGGGRIVGEACHFIDLCIFFTGSLVKSICMSSISSGNEDSINNGSILLKFENNSNAIINYFTNGSKLYSKERIELYSLERTWVIDNFQTTIGYGVKNFKKLKTKLDKGHSNQFKDYVNFLSNGGKPFIPINEIINGTKASFAALSSIKEKAWVEIT